MDRPQHEKVWLRWTERDKSPCCDQPPSLLHSTRPIMALSLQLDVPPVTEVASSLQNYDKRLKAVVKQLLPYLRLATDTDSTAQAAALAAQSLNFFVVKRSTALANTLNELKKEFLATRDFAALAQGLQSAGSHVLVVEDTGDNANTMCRSTFGFADNHSRNIIDEWLAMLVDRRVLERFAGGCLRHIVNHGVPAANKLPKEYFDKWEKQKVYHRANVELATTAANVLECTRDVLPNLVAFQLAQKSADLMHEYGTRLEATLDDASANPISVSFDAEKHDVWGFSPDNSSEISKVYHLCGPFNKEILHAETSGEAIMRKLTVVDAESQHKLWGGSDATANFEQSARDIVDVVAPLSLNNGVCTCCGLEVRPSTQAALAPAVAVAEPASSSGRAKRRSPSVVPFEPYPAAPNDRARAPREKTPLITQNDSSAEDIPKSKKRRLEKPAASAAAKPLQPAGTMSGSPTRPRRKSMSSAGKKPASRIDDEREGTKLVATEQTSQQARGKNKTAPKPKVQKEKQPKQPKAKFVVKVTLPTTNAQAANAGAGTNFDPLNLPFGTLFEVFFDGSKKWYKYRALWYFHGTFDNEKGLVLVAHPEGWKETDFTWIFLDTKGRQNVRASGHKPGEYEMNQAAKDQAAHWYDFSSADFLNKTARSWGIKREDVAEIGQGAWIRKGGPRQPPAKNVNWSVKAQVGKVRASG